MIAWEEKLFLMKQNNCFQLENKTREHAKEKLQMPPIMSYRKPISKIYSYDPELSGIDSAKYVFTDITFGVKDRVSCCCEQCYSIKVPVLKQSKNY